MVIPVGYDKRHYQKAFGFCRCKTVDKVSSLPGSLIFDTICFTVNDKGIYFCKQVILYLGVFLGNIVMIPPTRKSLALYGTVHFLSFEETEFVTRAVCVDVASVLTSCVLQRSLQKVTQHNGVCYRKS